MNEEIRRAFEPNSPTIKRRLSALRMLKENGVKTFVFLAPFIPILSERSLTELFEEFRASSVDYVVVDRLNFSRRNMMSLDRSFMNFSSDIRFRVKDILLNHMDSYYSSVKESIEILAKHLNLIVYFSF